jgi:hypothetical protein
MCEVEKEGLGRVKNEAPQAQYQPAHGRWRERALALEDTGDRDAPVDYRRETLPRMKTRRLRGSMGALGPAYFLPIETHDREKTLPCGWDAVICTNQVAGLIIRAERPEMSNKNSIASPKSFTIGNNGLILDGDSLSLFSHGTVELHDAACDLAALCDQP